MYFLIYILGVLIVWTIDKISSDEHNWQIVISRLMLASLSWLSLIVYLFVEVTNQIGYKISRKSDKQPPKWL